jgi:hypothetical protein
VWLGVLLITFPLLFGKLFGKTRPVSHEATKSRSFYWWCKFPVIAGVWWGSHLLAQTYSRGAWVAYGASLLVLLALTRGRRRPVVWLIVALVFNLLLLPAGGQRVRSGADFAEGSVHNRLVVYQGATAVIAQRPVSGVGWHKFSDYYWTWRHPPELTAIYQWALNNYLCLAAELGLPALWLYLVVMWSGVGCSAWLAVKTSSALAACLAAAQVVFQVAGMFTYTLTLTEIAWISPLILAVAVGQIFLSRAKPPSRQVFLSVATGALLLCGGLYAAGCFFAGRLPEKITFFDRQCAVLVTPNHQPVRAVVVYSADRGEDIQKLGRDTLRYLAGRGVATLAVSAPPNGSNSVAQISRLIERARGRFSNNTPVFVFGVNSGTRPALAAAGKAGGLDGVILLGSPYEWPEEEESPRHNLAKLTCPLYLMHGRHNFLVPWQDGLKLKAEAERLRIPVHWQLLPDYSHYFTAAEWQIILDNIIKHLLGESASTP